MPTTSSEVSRLPPKAEVARVLNLPPNATAAEMSRELFRQWLQRRAEIQKRARADKPAWAKTDSHDEWRDLNGPPELPYLPV